MKEKNVQVTIPAATANFIEKQSWFKYYRNIEDFVLDAVRLNMDRYIRIHQNGSGPS